MKGTASKTFAKDSYSYDGIPDPTNFGSSMAKNKQRKYIERFLSDLPGKTKVLEIGPGRGEFAEECKRRNWQYLGLESSEIMIEKLTAKDLFIINARVPPLPILDESFDLVHADQVIEHFNDVGEFTFFLRECYRALRVGGYLSLSCPNYLTLGKIFFDWDYTHRLTLTKYNLERACKDYRFKIVRNAYHLVWTLSDNWIMSILRYPLLCVMKFVNLSIFIEITDRIKFVKDLRLRITKNCLDNIIVIAQKI